MASNKAVLEAQRPESCGTAGDQDTSVQVRIRQVPAVTAVQPPPPAASSSKGDPVSGTPKVVAGGPRYQPPSTPPVIVVTNTSGGLSANSHVTKPTLGQVVSVSQATPPGRTVVITVPRSAAPQPVAPRLPQTVSSQLPANIQIPAGMMLIRSDGGQLMLVSQQVLAQAQQGPRGVSGPTTRVLAPQVSSAAGTKSTEKVTVIRMAAPSSFQPASVHKTAVVFGVAHKPSVVQTLSAATERGDQPRLQAAVTETKKEPATAFSQVSPTGPSFWSVQFIFLYEKPQRDSSSSNALVVVEEEVVEEEEVVLEVMEEVLVVMDEVVEEEVVEEVVEEEEVVVEVMEEVLVVMDEVEVVEEVEEEEEVVVVVEEVVEEEEVVVEIMEEVVVMEEVVEVVMDEVVEEEVVEVVEEVVVVEEVLETLESVKKCKNFLVTLIKLASSDSRSANMANNVRGLVRSLLEGKLEAEEFTEQLYTELKSTPQPCLVPFLKKSLPAVRCLTADPQLFIQQASASTRDPAALSSTVKQPSPDTGPTFRTSQQGVQQARGVTLRPALTTLVQSRNYIPSRSGPAPKHIVVQSGRHFSGSFSVKQPFTQEPPPSTKSVFKDTSGSYKEDDDINDVASMAGVNLREENAQSLTSVVGSVVQSCQDQPFLSPQPVLSRILHTGQRLGVPDVGPDVVSLVSHATQQFLRGLLQKLSVMAEHRKAALKDQWHAKVSDVRSQLRFLEEVESLKKKRRSEEERERLLRLARSRSHTEDPQHQQLRQRAKELQQIEDAQLQQREANLAALAAIGPRRKRPLDQTQSQGVHRVSRVMLRDLLLCMEQEPFLRHSLALYKAML
ncbi:transcription initiation factor TFIID subunit 4-like [Brachyistius frenatus]|uniref:transcription initiation factor TFIID subunit 4-like n=1 Tax=Brachyistius frenatus TaxID=100188 RepID=UPI0037E82786